MPLTDEPKRHPWFLILVALLGLGSVPFAFVGKRTVVVVGFPLWLWWSVVLTLLMAALTAWGVLRFWKDDDLD